jgi:hypothetical protein
MVGPDKGRAGAEQFGKRKAQLDAVQGQTDYQAGIHGLHFRDEASRVRETPESLLEIRVLVVRLTRVIWPKARGEVAGELANVGLPDELRIPRTEPMKTGHN